MRSKRDSGAWLTNPANLHTYAKPETEDCFSQRIGLSNMTYSDREFEDLVRESFEEGCKLAVRQFRERCKVILTSPEGLARYELAKAICFHTDLSPETARAILSASPEAVAADSNLALLAKYSGELEKENVLSAVDEAAAIVKAYRAMMGFTEPSDLM
jgi:hypothetical protein